MLVFFLVQRLEALRYLDLKEMTYNLISLFTDRKLFPHIFSMFKTVFIMLMF